MSRRASLPEIIARVTKTMTESQILIEKDCYLFERRQERKLLESLRTGRMSDYLILEAEEEEGPAFSEGDANKLQKAAEEMKGVIKDLGNQFPGGKFEKTKGALEALAGNMPDTGGIATMAIKGDVEGLADAVEEANEALTSMQKGAAMVVQSVIDVATNLKNFEKNLGDDDKKESLLALAGREDSDKAGKFVSTKDLESGIGKAFVVPSWFQNAVEKGMSAAKAAQKEEGFFDKAVGFLKGLFGGAAAESEIIPPKDFAEDVMDLTYEELLSTAEVMNKAQKGLETNVSTASTAVGVAQGSAAAMQGNADGGGGEDPPPASEKESKEAVADAADELQGAVADAAGSGDPPGVAIMAAIDGWVDGLSDTSQKSLQAKGRIDGLKDNIQTAIDGAAETLSDAVADAVNKWRSEHEETLVKSKRFAKKNFDSLSDLIPQLAAELLKKTNEAGLRLTRTMVRKSVYKYLDKKFRSQDTLFEAGTSQETDKLPSLTEILIPTKPIGEREQYGDYHCDEDELVRSRWMKVAGIKGY